MSTRRARPDRASSRKITFTSPYAPVNGMPRKLTHERCLGHRRSSQSEELTTNGVAPDVLHPESKQQTTPAAPRDALECVAALARTREDRQNCVRFAYRGPQVDRLHVLELKRDVE